MAWLRAMDFIGWTTPVAVLLAMALPAAAQDLKGWGGFLKEPINRPGTYKVVADPTGAGPTGRVHWFRIDAGSCSNKAHGNGNSDCTFNSVRAQAYEKSKSQPAKAWYAWSMYLPGDFPLAAGQPAGGHLSLAYWHNGECPNLDIAVPQGSTKLIMQTMRLHGKDCLPGDRITLGDAAKLRGKWHRFELHAVWSKGAEGLVEVFIDGNRAGAIRGANLTAGAPAKNYFKFGLYLNNTRGTKLVAPATAYFAGFTRADSREALGR